MTPQRHEHEHTPSVVAPVPGVTVATAAGGADDAGGAATAVVAVAAGGADDEPPTIGAAVPVPFWAMASCSNIAWVLLAVGLMEKVIPFPQ